MPSNSLGPKLRWYHTWRGLTIAGLCTFIVIAGIIFAAIVGRYYWLIRHGEGASLRDRFHPSAASADPARMALRARLELSERPYLGSPSAPVTIVEFVDFKCPFCRQADPIMYQVAKNFPKQVKIIFRHFPLESIHPGATRLAILAQCAHEQGAFWQTNNVLFENQDKISNAVTDDEVADIATKAQLDLSLLRSCMKEGGAADQVVRADFAEGVFDSVKATPTYFVNGDKADGVVPYKVWEGFFKQLSR